MDQGAWPSVGRGSGTAHRTGARDALRGPVDPGALRRAAGDLATDAWPCLPLPKLLAGRSCRLAHADPPSARRAPCGASTDMARWWATTESALRRSMKLPLARSAN